MESHETKHRRGRRSRPEINHILAAFGCSGLTQRAFCQEHGLSLATLANWRRREAARTAPAEAPASPLLRPVRLRPEALAAQAGPVVRLPEGVEIALAAGTSADEIAALITALKSLRPC